MEDFNWRKELEKKSDKIIFDNEVYDSAITGYIEMKEGFIAPFYDPEKVAVIKKKSKVKFDQFLFEPHQMHTDDEFTDAYIGQMTINDSYASMYDHNKILEILIERDGMDEFEAEETYTFDILESDEDYAVSAFVVTSPEFI